MTPTKAAIAAILLSAIPAQADTSKLQELGKIAETTAMLIKLQVKPEFKVITDQQIKEETCVRVETCPSYVSVHVPNSNIIYVNDSADLADLSNQAQIVHVLAMLAMEQDGQVSADQPCGFVAAKHAYAHVIQAAYTDIKLQELSNAAIEPPEFKLIQVHVQCAEEPVVGEF